MASRINAFLVENGLRLKDNPCVSPDFCLDWSSLEAAIRAGSVERYAAIPLPDGGTITLCEDTSTGDCGWIVEKVSGVDGQLECGVPLDSGTAYPASWHNLLRLKNVLQERDPGNTVFPSAAGSLDHASLGIGARFTTLHWPAVDWTMAQLGLSLTANQNSIPRELVYDVDVMLDDKLDTVLFPFIGGSVPEGHQGQSVEGMSHGSVLAKVKYGFHLHRLPWGFNADHQPIGGKFDPREDALVRGCLLATYITFDISPELEAQKKPDDVRTTFNALPTAEVEAVRKRVAEAGVALDEGEFADLMVSVYPPMLKMWRRDQKYAEARKQFTSEVGRRYFRELSIDELPGLTTPATLATMLALAEVLGMKINFVAPAFGFQKNFPFEDQVELERRISTAWNVCKRFGVSIGFHSGSGKSRENYELCGRLTGGNLEIKTSGRYTYEMGAALKRSSDPSDQTLWREWYAFTREIALNSAFGGAASESKMAREFIRRSLPQGGDDVFNSRDTCEAALSKLEPSPDHMFWFEYNFLFVLAKAGSAAKTDLGDHHVEGYQQRRRFYSISDDGKLKYSQQVAKYILFLADTTGLAPRAKCDALVAQVEGYTSYAALLADIAPRGDARL